MRAHALQGPGELWLILGGPMPLSFMPPNGAIPVETSGPGEPCQPKLEQRIPWQ
jgi:hypothetical protein